MLNVLQFNRKGKWRFREIVCNIIEKELSRDCLFNYNVLLCKSFDFYRFNLIVKDFKGVNVLEVSMIECMFIFENFFIVKLGLKYYQFNMCFFLFFVVNKLGDLINVLY